MASDQSKITVGFIGLGSQGGPMARRIVEAGYPTLLWARRPEALEAYADTAAQAASSIAELGARCDHVGVCVVDDAGTLEVCDALIAAMRPGGLIAIHSTIHPDTCRALAERAAARGLRLVDAPVSGGGHSAAAGTLTVMVGGEAEAVAQARPVFETFAGLIVHLGGVGAGQNVKLINNTLLAANMGLAHAAFEAGAALGIDRQAFAELVKASSGRSYGFEIYARLPTPGAFALGAPLLKKDADLLVATLPGNAAVATLAGVATPILDLMLGDK